MRSSFRTFVIAATAVVFGFSSAATAAKLSSAAKTRILEHWRSEFPAGQCIPEWLLDGVDPEERAFVLGFWQFCNKAIATGLSVSGSFGYASTASNFQVLDIFSADRRNEVTPNLLTPTTRAGFGGFAVALTSPTLFSALSGQGRYQQGGFALGVSAGMDFPGSNSATIQGLPGSPFPTVTGSDTINIKPINMAHVEGVLHIPIGWPASPEWWNLFDVYGKAGVGWVRSDVTYNCVGFCNFTPTVPAFSATQSTTQTGLYWGVGFGTPLPMKKNWFLGAPPILSFEFDQYSTGSNDVILGTTATRQVRASVGSQHVNLGRVSLTQPIVLSDMRLKRDIVALERLDNGLTLYRYRYLWSEELFVGVMAQEVAELMPQAVILRPEGYLAVDYAQLGLRLQTWGEWVSSH